MKYITKVKEIIDQNDCDDYEKMIKDKKDEVLRIKEEAAIKLLELESETEEIKAKLKDAGLERFDSFKIEQQLND